jgi:hypothetical protein
VAVERGDHRHPTSSTPRNGWRAWRTSAGAVGRRRAGSRPEVGAG